MGPDLCTPRKKELLALRERIIEDHKSSIKARDSDDNDPNSESYDIGLEELIQDDVKTVDFTADAVAHYYNGNGTAVHLGWKTRAQLRRNEDYLRVLDKPELCNRISFI